MSSNYLLDDLKGVPRVQPGKLRRSRGVDDRRRHERRDSQLTQGIVHRPNVHSRSYGPRERSEDFVTGEDSVQVYRWAPADLGELEESATGGSPGLSATNDDVIRQFRSNNGTIVKGLFAGMRGLLLHSVGAKSGAPRLNPLYRFDFQGRWYVIGSDGGSAKAPAWVHNLRAVSETCVEVGSNTGTGTVAHNVRVRELPEPERGRIWGELRREIPHVDGFQAKTNRVIPIFELSKHNNDDSTKSG